MPKLRLDVDHLAESLREEARLMTNYRIVFYRWMKIRMQEIAKFVQTEARRNVPIDTGTLKSRIDYKVEEWNTLEMGIYEDSAHPPTANVSRWTGRVRRADEEYGWYVERYHKTKAGFLTEPFFDHAERLIHKAVDEFNEDYFGKKK